ncbi:hypothetical protein F511_25468 [Dorcoceras hygrometricum]|uniref:Uncharacterized protein n=1 Tax=Dorcoceras hygrometricum TaxID=472368 RepID=A0A2Z7CJ33_9LAMI|nr:hypothetical protein F511_25468 [Dorcoceras hygrometricum]
MEEITEKCRELRVVIFDRVELCSAVTVLGYEAFGRELYQLYQADSLGIFAYLSSLVVAMSNFKLSISASRKSLPWLLSQKKSGCFGRVIAVPCLESVRCVVPEKSNDIIGVVTARFECLPPSRDGLTSPDDHGPMISTGDWLLGLCCPFAGSSGNQAGQSGGSAGRSPFP